MDKGNGFLEDGSLCTLFHTIIPNALIFCEVVVYSVQK
jgi:hypothetical protein